AAGSVETRAWSGEEADPVALSPLVFTRATVLTQADAAIAGFAEAFRRGVRSAEGLAELAAAVLEKMPFRPGDTGVSSTAAEAFATGAGVCQDHTHVFIACCRYLGIPARYVSGYLCSGGAQAASHAWAEAWTADR